MVKQRGRRGRALRNDRRAFRPVREALSAAPAPRVFRTRHNRKYGHGEFLACMARAAATNRSTAAAARRLRRDRNGRHPTPEWFRERLARAAGGQAEGILAASAARQMGAIPAPSTAPGKCLVTVDMHDNARRDRRPGVRLVRSRKKRGTQYLGRVTAAQCAGEEARITLAMAPVGAPDSVPDALRRTTGTAGRACAEAGAEPALPVGRGLTGVGVLRVLREEGAGYMMVRRTDGVVDATAGRAAGARASVPAVTMGPGGAGEDYAAVIVPRRDASRREGAPPREGLVAFAAGAPWAGVEWHGRRRGTGSRYREPGRARIRTATTNPAGRALCMAYSPVMLNAWAAAMSMAIRDAIASRVANKSARITHSWFCDVAEAMADQGLLLPEPPPRPP